MTAEGHVLSEHTTTTEAESAALARLREDGQLVVVDRYDRCHRRERPNPTRAPSRPYTSSRD